MRSMPEPARRALVAACAVLATSTSLGPSAAATSSTTSAATIDTYDDWSGQTALYEFGPDHVPTRGQVITIPAGHRRIHSFTFWMAGEIGHGPITVRGEIYTWDGGKAGRQIWESEPQVVDSDWSDPVFHPVRMRDARAEVRPGRQYVLFLTTSRDDGATAPHLASKWADVYDDVLAGGHVLNILDDGDETLWTTQTWETFPHHDLAVRVKLRR